MNCAISENIVKNFEDMRGFTKTWHHINNIRHADETLLIAENDHDLRIVIIIINRRLGTLDKPTSHDMRIQWIRLLFTVRIKL